MHWKEVPAEQKVTLVAQTVELGVEFLIDLPEFINDVVDLFKAFRNFLYRSSLLGRLGNAFGRIATPVGQWVEDIAQAL